MADPGGEVTAPGAWGPWVDGGAWLRIDGTAVDWLYRDLDRVRACWRDAQDGRFAFHAQVGHPLGVPDFAYAGELGLDVERFTDDLRGHVSTARVADDVDSADLSGVTGTPTFFVNGRRHHGASILANFAGGWRNCTSHSRGCIDR